MLLISVSCLEDGLKRMGEICKVRGLLPINRCKPGLLCITFSGIGHLGACKGAVGRTSCYKNSDCMPSLICVGKTCTQKPNSNKTEAA